MLLFLPSPSMYSLGVHRNLVRILFRKTESFAPLSIYILTFSIVIEKSDKILIPDPFM